MFTPTDKPGLHSLVLSDVDSHHRTPARHGLPMPKVGKVVIGWDSWLETPMMNVRWKPRLRGVWLNILMKHISAAFLPRRRCLSYELERDLANCPSLVKRDMTIRDNLISMRVKYNYNSPIARFDLACSPFNLLCCLPQR